MAALNAEDGFPQPEEGVPVAATSPVPQAAEQPALAQAPASAPSRPFRAHTAFFALLLLYFGLHTVLRVASSTTAELDEAEQLVLTQDLRWGYGPQAPLYTWLQYAVFAVVGPSVLGLSLLKNALLLAAYVFTYASAWRIARNPWAGAAAAASLLFIPQMAWESQRDLTHTVLATTLAAGTLCAFLRVSEHRSAEFIPPARATANGARGGMNSALLAYLGLGACIGLGLLAKYNYAIFIASLLAAALSLPQSRSVVLDRRMLAAVGVAAALFAPHALWMAQHRSAALSAMKELGMDHAKSWFFSALQGTWELASAGMLLIAPLLLIYGVLYRRRLSVSLSPIGGEGRSESSVSFSSIGGEGRGEGSEQLLLRQMLFVPALLLLVVLVFKVTGIKDRWLLPMFVGLPVLLAAKAGRACVSSVASCSTECFAWRGVLVLAGVVAVVVLVLMPGHLLLGKDQKRPFRLNAQFRDLAAQLGPPPAGTGLIIAENRWIGGNLRLCFPGQRIAVPEFPASVPTNSGGLWVVWNATARDMPPENLLAFVRSVTSLDAAGLTPRFVEAIYRHLTGQRMRLGVLALESVPPR